MTGTIISRIQFGDYPAFIISGHSISSMLEFAAFALLGVVSAMAAIIFMRSIAILTKFAQGVPAPRWSHPMIGEFLVGLIALFFPQVLGVGYGATDAALKELLPLWPLIALVVAKMAAAIISLGAGFGGAMLGGAFGIISTSVSPDLSSGHGAYTLVDMGPWPVQARQFVPQ